MDVLQNIKQRFGIIGNDIKLQKALEKAVFVAPTDASVLIIGESGVGKEAFARIIHNLSQTRKHYPCISVNCGAIAEGTIDSELFGHEKGAFTGANTDRKGYFETANKGTLFLDEVGDLPLSTQVRLLRVLENGEFIKVGSSKVQKSDVRIVAATNVDINEATKKKEFREDLYYRLSTIEIYIPSLRERKGDIGLLVRNFASDFSKRHQNTPIRFDKEAILYLENYPWPGNIRQLKNFVEEVSILESQEEDLSLETIKEYLPNKIINKSKSPASIYFPIEKTSSNYPITSNKSANEGKLFYELFYNLFKEVAELKKIVLELIKNKNPNSSYKQTSNLIPLLNLEDKSLQNNTNEKINEIQKKIDLEIKQTQNLESLSLEEKEIEFIKKALEKHKGNRKLAAQELGISVRTLYRKIKEFDL